MRSQNIETLALRFAKKAHGAIGHKRKYTGEPYFHHLANVALMVYNFGGDENMIAAAFLHDVVEDTPATIKQIEEEFGSDVASLVADLTDVSKPEDGNRAARKKIDREHTFKASVRAKTVKLADIIDNTRDIVEHDLDFARVYLPEMRALLLGMAECDAALYAAAEREVARGFEAISL